MNGVKSPIMTYRYCTDNFGVGPSLTTRLGNAASIEYLQAERMVAYIPNPRFLGPDFFTYTIYDGLGEQTHTSMGGSLTPVHEITTHVRYCRKFESQLQKMFSAAVHPLCDCAASESGIISNITLCTSVRVSICQVPTSRYAFLNLCLSCETQGQSSFACGSETVRAVGMLTERGNLILLFNCCFDNYFFHVYQSSLQVFVLLSRRWIV
jgi:hypothetical protein